MSSSFPLLSALFLTHFDDLKGQSVIYYQSINEQEIPQGTIEHSTLPSGLHLLSTDLILFTHFGKSGVGLFRSREVLGGRGRRMGSLGVLLAENQIDQLFNLEQPLSELYDRLECLSSPFDVDGGAREILDEVWEKFGKGGGFSVSESGSGSVPRGGGRNGEGSRSSGGISDVERARQILDGRIHFPSTHPITTLPSLLSILGPAIIPLYKAAISSQRILLYSTPPLLPLAAFAYLLHLMSASPSEVVGEKFITPWIGNVGLMDLTGLKGREGAWVATTSDAILKSHPIWDLYLDLSTSPPTLYQPGPKITTYTFANLPLYRTLLSPIPTAETINSPGGFWLVAYNFVEKVWQICYGVCGFGLALGQGAVRLEDGEEDARLLDNEGLTLEDEVGEGEVGEGSSGEDDEAVQRGRIILRQLQHHTLHLYKRLRAVHKGAEELKEAELRELCGYSNRWFRSSRLGEEEARFWVDLASRWGISHPSHD